jgi:transcription initiation factor TFIIIB Brf1 subunit/transcription initiation factor TFIIB
MVIAADGEVVCEKCGTVLGQVKIKSVPEEQIDRWDAQADLCRTLLEEHVSKRGWEF